MKYIVTDGQRYFRAPNQGCTAERSEAYEFTSRQITELELEFYIDFHSEELVMIQHIGSLKYWTFPVGSGNTDDPAKAWHCTHREFDKYRGTPGLNCVPVPDYSDVQIQSSETGDHLRKDDGKPRFDLIPPEFLFALAELYDFGAKKYADRGWEKGMSYGRCFAAMMRHAWKFWNGEDFDDDSGVHHIVAVAWNAIAIYTYYARGIGEDDRVKLF